MFLTGVGGKRVVVAPVFSPYQAAPPSAATTTELIKALTTPPGNAAEAAQNESLRLPDLEILEPFDIHTVGNQEGGDLRLKFGTMIWNAGAGPLVLRIPKPSSSRSTSTSYPRGEGQAQQGKRIGTFDCNHRHGHLHLQTFARYQLWSLGRKGKLEGLVATNDKVGFCLMDIKPVDLKRRNAASAPVYAGCRADVQGISVGYGDEYVAQLFEQDLDITNLPDGNYALVTVANPDREIDEARYRNNVSAVMIALKGGALVPYPVEL